MREKYRHLGRKKKQITPSICKWDPGFKDICISDLSRHDYWRKTAFEPCLTSGRWFIAGTGTCSVRGSLRKRETQITSYWKHCKALGSSTIKNNLLQSSTGKDLCKQRKSKLTESKTPFDTHILQHNYHMAYCNRGDYNQ